MANELSGTYLPDEHMVILYRNEYEVNDILVNYIKTNLEKSIRCIYIKGDTNTDLIVKKLAKLIDINQYLETKQFLIVDKTQSYSKDGSFNPDKMIDTLINETKSAISMGYNGLAVTGEISWVLGYEDGFDRILEYEWKLNEKVFSKYPISSICRYNLDKFTDEMIQNIIQVHPYIIWKNQAHENPFYIPFQAFKYNQISRYQVITWLDNISKFSKTKSSFQKEIKKRNQELRESEEQYKYIFENSPIGKSITSPDGNIRVNKTFCSMLGYTKEEINGENWGNITHPDDVYKGEKAAKDLLEDKIKVARFSKRYIKKNGDILWADVHISIRRDENNNPMYFMTSVIDITQQKKSKIELEEAHESYKTMFDEAPLPYQSLDEEGRFITVNKAWLDLLGFEKDEVIGRSFGDFIDSKYISHFKTNFPKFKEEGATCTSFEMPRKNGDLAVINFEGKIGYNKDGSFRQTHCILQDITDKKRAERLENEKRKAEEETRIKSDFLANMSHEIRTPMNAVIGLADLLNTTNLDSKQKEYIDKLSLSAKSLLHLINDILDFSKLESDMIQLERIEFSLSELIESIKTIMSINAEKKGIEFIIIRDKEIPNILIGDPLRLQQILINLFSNAIKFTERGSITLKIEKLSDTSNNIKLKFSIKDTGIGIREEDQSKLFNVFTQADSSTTRNYGGSGLGLSICKDLVMLMGGEIWFYSNVGVGSTFLFTISLEKHIEQFDEQQENSKKYSRNETLDYDDMPRKGARVLLVEDNDINQLVTSEMLKSLDCTVDIADNGQIALEKTISNKYDLILMDLQMPIMDGFDASKHIRNKDITTPIIALSADVIGEIKDRAKESGMDDYLSKPIEMKQLKEALSKWIKK